jgi:perosamine synthetase
MERTSRRNFKKDRGTCQPMRKPAWRFRGKEEKYIKEVLSNGFRAGSDGAFTSKFEKAFASKYRTNYGIAFNSGTSTLHAALLALGCGPGDEVIVPSLTPLMCGLAIHYTGATPVYVDSNDSDFLMNPDQIEGLITDRTKVILVVHMYGGVCDIVRITEIAQNHSLKVLEDCAQCHWGFDNKGNLAGTIGNAGSWSFENSKQLTCGDGGIITTNNPNLATKIRKIGGLGFKTLNAESGAVRTNKALLQNPNWERFDEIGFNYRMNQLAAAVALAQVERSDSFIELRIKAAESYLDAIGDSQLLIPQFVKPGYRYSYYTFSAKFNGDKFGITWEDFREKYMERGGDGIYAASKLLYQEPIFKSLQIGRGRTPVAESLQKKLMNFTTNQKNKKERITQYQAMSKTLEYFKKFTDID